MHFLSVSETKLSLMICAENNNFLILSQQKGEIFSSLDVYNPLLDTLNIIWRSNVLTYLCPELSFIRLSTHVNSSLVVQKDRMVIFGIDFDKLGAELLEVI